MKKKIVTMMLAMAIALMSFSYIVLIADAATGTGMTELSVKTNKLAYEYGEEVLVTITAKNIGQEPVALEFTTACQADFTIDNIYNETLYPRMCAQMLTSVNLDPGATEEWEFTFSPGTTEFPKLMPGEHEITAMLIDYSATATTTFSVGYAVEGEGQFCGGIGGVSCADGMSCKYDGTYPDAGGYCTSDAPEGNNTLFTDLSTNHWSYDYVAKLVENEIVQGYEDGSFHPDSPVTRAELVKMALMSAQIGALEGDAPVNCDRYDGSYCTGMFTDLDDWQKAWVFQAQAMGFVDGYSEETFAPNNNVTRAEALKIMELAFGVTSEEFGYARDVVDTIFTDFDWDSADIWFGDYVAYALVNGIAQGYGDDTFGPGRNITRAEAAKMLSNLMETRVILSGDMTTQDLVDFTIGYARIKNRISDTALIPEGEPYLFSDKNLDGLTVDWVDQDVLIKTEAELQQIADTEGDFLYFHFDTLNIGETEAEVSLSLSWKTATDSQVGYLSGGGFSLKFHMENGRWVKEDQESVWIS